MLEVVACVAAGTLVAYGLTRPPTIEGPYDRLIRENPRCTAGALVPGQTAQIRGRVEPLGGSVTAPLTGTPCIAYEFRVFEVLTGSTVKRIHERASRPFAVRDDTGQVIVRPDGADLWLETNVAGEVGTLRPLPPRLRRLLLDSDAIVGPLDLRCFMYSEFVLCAGDDVAVVGPVAPGSADPAMAPLGYRNTAEGSVIEAREDAPFLVANKENLFAEAEATTPGASRERERPRRYW